MNSSPKTTIYLVRHGQTVLNAQVRFRGRMDVPLNEIGRSEAIAAGIALRDKGLSAVYASPLIRAREVGTAIAAASGVPAVEDLDQLVNLHYGRWEGLTKEESEEDDPQEWSLYLDDPERCTCPDGEKLAVAADRVVEGLRVIASRHPGQTVAAVSHGVMLRLAVLRTAGQIGDDWQFKMPTGAALVFEVMNGEISFVGPTWESELGAPLLTR